MAVVENPENGESVAAEMSKAFLEFGKLETNTSQVVSLCNEGAVSVESMPDAMKVSASAASAA